MSAVIEVDGLSRWYGEVVALNAVSLRLTGGVVGLLGPNGAGKSTLLRILAGQIRPSRGSARVLGLEPFANPELYRRVGIVPDVEALPDHLTGSSFLRAMARLSGSDHAAADRTLEEVGLAEAAARRIGSYSKGMRQRLRLGQALVHRPGLLLLDEPLSGLDPLARHDVCELVRGFGAASGTVIVSSHILHEIEAMTSHVLLILDGRVRAEGEVAEIRARIESEPRRIAVRSSDPKRLAADLLALGSVKGVSIAEDGRTLTVRTTAAGEVFKLLPSLALRQGVAVDEIRSEDEDLESVFGYLVRRP